MIQDEIAEAVRTQGAPSASFVRACAKRLQKAAAYIERHELTELGLLDGLPPLADYLFHLKGERMDEYLDCSPALHNKNNFSHRQRIKMILLGM